MRQLSGFHLQVKPIFGKFPIKDGKENASVVRFLWMELSGETTPVLSVDGGTGDAPSHGCNNVENKSRVTNKLSPGQLQIRVRDSDYYLMGETGEYFGLLIGQHISFATSHVASRHGETRKTLSA